MSSKISPSLLNIDFLHGKLNYRRQFGGGKNQFIAKAMGKNKTVLDVTAGLGRDAFILATIGYQVTMCERSPLIYEQLKKALQIAEKETWFQKLSLKLIHTDSLIYLSQLTHAHSPDVIYIDPMFPERTKSALVKKEMRLLRELVGDDEDSEALLEKSLCVAKKRVVVKRPRLAPTLSSKKPDLVYKGKSSRFDIYLCGKR